MARIVDFTLVNKVFFYPIAAVVAVPAVNMGFVAAKGLASFAGDEPVAKVAAAVATLALAVKVAKWGYNSLTQPALKMSIKKCTDAELGIFTGTSLGATLGAAAAVFLK